MAGHKLIITAALTLANIGLTASQRINGPRLDDLSYTGSDPGTPRVWFRGKHSGVKSSIWGEPLLGIERERKTKGGKYSNTDYYDTEAIEIASHPVDAVTRIWADEHLIFDLTGAGPISPFDFGERAPGSSGSIIRIYLGEDDQEPDPTMQASVEAERGVGFCPAYRDTPYFVADRLPVGNFGNRRPQFRAEAVVSASPSWVDETFDTETGAGAQHLWNGTISGDGQRFFIATSDGGFDLIDLPSRTIIAQGTLPIAPDNNERVGMFKDGRIAYQSNVDGKDIVYLTAYGTLSHVDDDALAGVTSCNGLWVLEDGDGNEHLLGSVSAGSTFYFAGVIVDTAAAYGVAFEMQSFCRDSYGDIWGVGYDSVSETAYLVRLVNTSFRPLDDFQSVSGFTVGQGGPADGIMHNASQSHFVLLLDDDLYSIDDTTFAVKATRALASFSGFIKNKKFANIPVGADSAWLEGGTEISLETLQDIRTIDLANFPNNFNGSVLYVPVLHAFISYKLLATTGRFYYIDRVTGDTVTLGTITRDICLLAGMDPSDFDVSALTTPIVGYGASQGDGKDWLAPLHDLYDVDARPDGFLLDFVPRGGAVGDVILADDFARPDDPDQPFHSRLTQGSTDLPRQVTLKFRDANADLEPNSQQSPALGSSDGQRELILDFGSLALVPDEGVQLATRYHRRLEFDGFPASLSLPASEIALQPADRHLLGFASGNSDYRLESMVLGADMRIETKWKRDDPSVALLNGAAGAARDGHIPTEIVVPTMTRGMVVDIPLVRDSDDSTLPIAYAAAAPLAGGAWPGAITYQGFGTGAAEEFDEEFETFASADRATWGTASGVLGTSSAFVWDRGNTLDIVMKNGELIGASEDAIDANPRLNLLLVGQELIQFSVSNLIAPDTYRVSILKRGRRGTEWAIDSHAVGETVLAITDAEPNQLELAEIGTSQRFKTVTLGRTDGFIETLAVEGNSLKPYAPINVTVVKQANGDWLFKFNRRTRIGAGWGSIDVPLGEASEEYELDLGDGVGTVTKTANDETYTWLQADQVAEMGGEVAIGALQYSIQQMSEIVGRGFATAGSA